MKVSLGTSWAAHASASESISEMGAMDMLQLQNSMEKKLQLESLVSRDSAAAALPRIDAAWSNRDMWNVFDQVSSAELGGASNAGRQRSLAETGGAALELVSSQRDGTGNGLNPDRSLANAVAQWLAGTVTPDDGVEVSKYVGETEKNLDPGFGSASASGAMLLFDEADPLLNRRTEVHDSHDRYANTESGFLLQKLERHDGVTIMTSNAAPRIDPNLRERAKAVVVFPLPPR